MVKQSGSWEIVFFKGGELVPKRENEHPKLLGLLQTESVITSRTRIWGNNRGGHPPKESGAAFGRPAKNKCIYSSGEELGKIAFLCCPTAFALCPQLRCSRSVPLSQFWSHWKRIGFLFLAACSHNQQM